MLKKKLEMNFEKQQKIEKIEKNEIVEVDIRYESVHQVSGELCLCLLFIMSRWFLYHVAGFNPEEMGWGSGDVPEFHKHQQQAS